MLRMFLGGCVVLALAVWLVGGEQQSAPEKPAPQLRTQVRRPIALAILGEKLLVANRQSGSISVIDRSQGAIVSEHSIASRIADMISRPGSESVLVLDDQPPKLWKVTWKDETPSVRLLAELPFAGSKLAVDETHRRIFLTAKWAHQVMLLQMDEAFERILQTETISLPFAPLELLPLPQENKLLVAEAFGNRLAVLDVKDGAAQGACHRRP